MRLSIPQLARLSALLDEALTLDATDRRRWFDALSPDNSDLASKLEEALFPGDAVGSGVDVLGTLPKFSFTDISPGESTSSSAQQAGTKVGPYELERRLGAGGMAEVWLAHRIDGAYTRAVALKLPAFHRRRGDLALRFAYERDILAGLEHVNIARFYDAGVADDGLPYLAMEYVPGAPLTKWCDKRRLPIAKRIELFLQVLDAVQYAHARGVVHRDIKPSNVLVSDSGEVRLLDFGVAKLLADVGGGDDQLTELYGRPLTPDYASPEYLSGGQAKIASDIYSLGVMLYELLAGNRPYRLGSSAPAVAAVDVPPPAPAAPPSANLSSDAGGARGTSQRRLCRALAGDLDAIVLKAMARDPYDRYASALALAQDLKGYLRGDPVEARCNRLGYRAGKFVLRHRLGLLAGAGATFLVAALAMGLLQNRPSPSSAPVAEAQNALVAPEKSIAVLPFTDLSEGHDQEYFSEGLADEILHLLGRIADLKVAARTSAFSFKGRSDDILTIGQKLQVAHILEGSVRKTGNAVRISVQLIKAVDGYQVWSQTYDRRLDDVFKVQGDIAADVAKALKAVLASGIPRTATAATNSESYFLYLRARDQMYRTGDYEKVSEQFAQLCRLDPGFAPAWAELSFVRSEMATNSNDRDPAHWDELRNMARKAIALDPQFPGGHVSLAKIFIYHDWNWAGAELELHRALALEPSDWAVLQFSALLARFLQHYDEAFDYLRRAQAVDPLNGFSYGLLATTSLKAGRLDDAQAAIERVKSIFPGDKLFIYGVGGDVKLARGQYAEAMADFERLPRRYALHGLVVANFALGQKEQSNAVLAEYQRTQGNDDASGIAAAHAYRGELGEALSWLERALAQHENMADLKGDPNFRALWSAPRYKAILRAVNLIERGA